MLNDSTNTLSNDFDKGFSPSGNNLKVEVNKSDTVNGAQSLDLEIKSLNDFINFLINRIIFSTFFLDLYYNYCNGSYYDSITGKRFINKSDPYKYEFIEIQSNEDKSKNLKWCNFIIYKFRRLLLMIIKFGCFLLDICMRIITACILLMTIICILIVTLNFLNVIEVKVVSCKFGLSRCN